MATRPSVWTMKVHSHCLRNGVGMKPFEAVQNFGPPPTSSTAAAILCSAQRSGWFRREAGRYYALDKANQPQLHNKLEPRVSSYFYGIKRVRSIFELAETL